MNTKKLIEKVNQVKKTQKITTAILSKKSGVPLGTLNKILSGGTKSVKLETVNKLLETVNAFNGNSINCLNENNDNFGFVKVASASFSGKVADVSYNLSKIKEIICNCCDKNVNVLVFQELSLTMSTVGDLVFQETLLSSALSALFDLVSFSKDKEILIFVGLPIKNQGVLHNVCACVCKGEILGFIPKANYKAKGFCDERYYSSCNIDEITIDNKTYPFSNNLLFVSKENSNFTISCEVGELSLNQNVGAITVNLSSSNELIGKPELRCAYIKAKTANSYSACVYANAGSGESTTDYVFSGHSIIAENGKILKQSELFKDSLIISDVDVEFLSNERAKNKYLTLRNNKLVYFSIINKFIKLDRVYSKTPFIPKENKPSRYELILKMQASALQKRIRHVNPKTLVLGVSGGLDSTLALLVAVRAMKNENRSLEDIVAITMPCFGTTSRTKNNATVLAENLGVTFKEINIKNSVLSHFNDISQNVNDLDVTYENSQARERTQVLMDYANKTGGLVLGTGDLSEMALGWATYNGDHMSMYSVNASIPKTLLRELVEYESDNLNRLAKERVIDILSTPVSPELIPPKNNEITQKTEDIVGPYILHDFYIYHALRGGFKPSKILYIAENAFKGEFDKKTLYKWLKNFYNRFFVQQFKRSCIPDGAKLGSVGLSPRGDLVMPSDASKIEWIKDLESIEI